jgi:hypothetical protein
MRLLILAVTVGLALSGCMSAGGVGAIRLKPEYWARYAGMPVHSLITPATEYRFNKKRRIVVPTSPEEIVVAAVTNVIREAVAVASGAREKAEALKIPEIGPARMLADIVVAEMETRGSITGAVLGDTALHTPGLDENEAAAQARANGLSGLLFVMRDPVFEIDGNGIAWPVDITNVDLQFHVIASLVDVASGQILMRRGCAIQASHRMRKVIVDAESFLTVQARSLAGKCARLVIKQLL